MRAERPDCPPRLAAVIEACLAKDPEDRPSADALARALAAIRAEPSAGPASVDDPTLVISRRPPARKRRSSRIAWIGLVLLLLLAAAAAGCDRARARRRGAVHRCAGRRDRRCDLRPRRRRGGERHRRRSGDRPRRGHVLVDGGLRRLRELRQGGRRPGRRRGRRAAARELTVTSDLPGWSAQIRAGDSTTSFPASVGETQRRRADHDVAARRRWGALLPDLDHGDGPRRRGQGARARERGHGARVGVNTRAACAARAARARARSSGRGSRRSRRPKPRTAACRSSSR